MEKEITVSVFCLTYNHIAFIRDTLEGFVSQKTTFKYEVIIHDDCSNDGTTEVIREYAAKYPEIIKPIYQEENQYSKGIPVVVTHVHPHLKGRYLAWCEGDDRWIDEYKLQKQFEALETHPECDMCAHAAELFDCQVEKVTDTFPAYKEDRILSTEEVIAGGGEYLATCSLFMRAPVRLEMMPFQKFYICDYTTQIRGSLRGGIVFLKDVMSQYRFRSKGSWTATYVDNLEMQKKIDYKLIRMYEMLDEETDGRYHDTISICSRKRQCNRLIAEGGMKALLDHKNAHIFEVLSAKEKLGITVKLCLPFMIGPVRLFKMIRSKLVN